MNALRRIEEVSKLDRAKKCGQYGDVTARKYFRYGEEQAGEVEEQNAGVVYICTGQPRRLRGRPRLW